MNNFAAIFLGVLVFVFAIFLAGRMTGDPTPREPGETQAIAKRIAPIGEVKIVQPPINPPSNTPQEPISPISPPIPAPNPPPVAVSNQNNSLSPVDNTPCASNSKAIPQCLTPEWKIYIAACFACHETGAAGAPQRGDVAAWHERLRQDRDLLLNHVLNGFKNMPRSAGNPELTEEEIQKALSCLIPLKAARLNSN